jgi:hypothetical protein
MPAQDIIAAAQLEAAHALSRILTQQEISHAFIGGFGVRLLGALRPTDDIDAIIDVSDPLEITNRIRPLLQEQDSRFSVKGLKLYFTSEAYQDVQVAVEILAVRTLGLPPRITTLSSGNRMEPSSNPLTRPKADMILQKTSPCYNPASSF